MKLSRNDFTQLCTRLRGIFITFPILSNINLGRRRPHLRNIRIAFFRRGEKSKSSPSINHEIVDETRLMILIELRPLQLGAEPRILQVLHVHILLPRPLRAPRPHPGK